MIVAVTGHQPPALGGFDEAIQAVLVALARDWIRSYRPCEVVSGMAPGWDIAVAEAARIEGVPLTAALAYPEQGDNWPEAAREALARLLAGARLVHVAYPRRTAGMWTRRDRWVLERGQRVLALWSGAEGGTGRAVAVARALGLPVDNLWDEWLARAPRMQAQGLA